MANQRFRADHIASLFIPPALFAPDENAYFVPCSAAAPRVGVVIEGRSFYIHADDLMNRAPGAVGDGGVVDFEEDFEVDSDDGDGEVRKGKAVFGKGKLCTLAVQRQRVGGNAVLGDSWLKNVLAVFDLGGNMMRFAGREIY